MSEPGSVYQADDAPGVVLVGNPETESRGKGLEQLLLVTLVAF